MNVLLSLVIYRYIFSISSRLIVFVSVHKMDVPARLPARNHVRGLDKVILARAVATVMGGQSVQQLRDLTGVHVSPVVGLLGALELHHNSAAEKWTKLLM